MHVLTVLSPFDAYAVGDRVTDAEAVKAILESERAVFVVRTAEAEVEPAPAPPPAENPASA